MSPPLGMERLIGEWDAAGEMEIAGRKINITGHASIEQLGEFVVLRSTVSPAEFPDSISVIGGGPDGDAQPMHYFDERGVQRVYLSKVDNERWTIWVGDDSWRVSPGHNQRYVGEVSVDGSRIDGAWWRGLGDAGDQWVIDFTLDYARSR